MTIKRISIEQLQPGMFIHDLKRGWFNHSFMLSRFRVKDEETVGRIAAQGIREVLIDTDRGSDVREAPTLTEVRRETEKRLQSLGELRQKSAPRTISLDEERRRAETLYREATRTLKHLLENRRQGYPLEVARLEPLIERMTDSVFRHDDALIPLAQLKQQSTYTFEHAVASAALMLAFGRKLGLERAVLRDIATGAMLQDLGMAEVPEDIVNKPSQMTRDELALLQGHVKQTHLLLGDLDRLPEPALTVIAQHHERVDGTGYPYRLAGDEISLYGQMAAIVDVYDAITSVRPYRPAITPPAAIQELHEWSRDQFNAELVQKFIGTVGLYPVGTLVKLESGRLAVVVEQTGNMLQPKVRIFYHTKTGNFLPPQTITVGRGSGANHGPIVSHESFADWRLDPARWVP